MINYNVREGIHSEALNCVETLFSPIEKNIVDIFKTYWFVTKAEQIKIGNSTYRYILIKAPVNLADYFNLPSEIIAVFSPYEKLEPRTYDAFDVIRCLFEYCFKLDSVGVVINSM